MIINLIMDNDKRSPKILTEIKHAKIFKQIIIIPHPYPTTFLPRYPVLSSPEKQLFK